MTKKQGKILVVDDNLGIRKALQLLLPPHFAEVELIASPTTLPATMERMQPDVVLLDMNFHADINSGNEGLYWTNEILRRWPGTQVVLFTAYADISLAVEGMKRGAFDFIAKPWDNEKLIDTLLSAYQKKQKLHGRDHHAPKDQSQLSRTPFFWGSSHSMAQLQHLTEKVAPTDTTVLITGENGTGKDVLAHEIHALSLRSDRPMVCVDAGAITETLFESELFGHVKGAFTDAHSDHKGKFEQADGGTLFLDEVGNLPLHLQAKLLRVLQERKVVRVGSERAIPVDIRLICATNCDLEAMVREGTFRQDLYFRIHVFHLHLPALREHTDDIGALAQLFLDTYAQRYHRQVSGLTSEAITKLCSSPWRGNIRELQNVIERAVILSEGTLLTANDIELPKQPSTTVLGKLEAAEEQTIREALANCNGNLSMVAKQLGISRPTLYAKLKRYKI